MISRTKPTKTTRIIEEDNLNTGPTGGGRDFTSLVGAANRIVSETFTIFTDLANSGTLFKSGAEENYWLLSITCFTIFQSNHIHFKQLFYF